LTVRNELVSGQWLVEEVCFEGTHLGPMEMQAGTLPATAKTLAIKAVLITRYESDLALETRLYFDQVDVLHQLGAMRALATVAV
jgi:hypothetical protein